ncbi:MAG: ABC transporter permease, partial [Gammaproteobacteria bacterium]
MKLLSLALLSFSRDWRAGEMRLISIAIIVAVTSLTSVSFFTDRVNQATETQATELLAADLVLESRQPIPVEIYQNATTFNLIQTNIISIRSMVVADEKIQMAEIKAVESGYPIRGILRISDNLFSNEKNT